MDGRTKLHDEVSEFYARAVARSGSCCGSASDDGVVLTGYAADDLAGLPDWVRENKSLYSACVAGAISESDYVAGLRAAGLADVEVRDRLVYDAGQLEAMYREEIPDTATVREAGESTEAALRRAAAEVAGKVWSINVYARKPEA